MNEAPLVEKNSRKNKKNWRENLSNLLNLEKNKERREKLLKEASKSYLDDFQEMKYHQGKKWIAPNYLFNKDQALYIANFYGRTLLNVTANTTPFIESSAASLVSIFSSKSGEEHIKSFLTPKLYLEASNLKFIYINLQENFLKAMLVRLFSKNIKNSISKEYHNTYFFINKLPKDIKENMLITNIYVGYIYLVDNQCRIRWAGCGNATTEEKENLVICSQKLIKEYEKV
ncbi:hypothetical protein T552_02454 [Pneumocystis carinii B80]|uniref:Mitochondrial ATPase complex subunit ATP10 n=1 Tax=Pneumocystis carinii (strain B80) TaxID=1408658 RepID=A0A0W4ZF09_PNEC8|nr:hypothetical protein T552_02454 [Pneumocystis carinii B80]KTW26963.1 hypothetical protein T552_02454 [Pneumocystis carinii B80]